MAAPAVMQRLGGGDGENTVGPITFVVYLHLANQALLPRWHPNKVQVEIGKLKRKGRDCLSALFLWQLMQRWLGFGSWA